ncbi:MAG: hypothetical protein Q4G67_15500, partial [Actinomycetia bacterium]|nr:hypothetical protein [Actinomycetes bacterium]
TRLVEVDGVVSYEDSETSAHGATGHDVRHGVDETEHAGGPGRPATGADSVREAHGDLRYEEGARTSVDTLERPVPSRATVPDLTGREKLVIVPLIALFLVLGFYPKPALDVINPAVSQTLQYTGVTEPAPTVPATNGSAQ